MIGSKYLKLTIASLIFLLTIDIGSRFFFSPSVVSAKSNTQYKVVEIQKGKRNSEGYEKLLNDMTNKGWEFDQTIYDTLIVFKK